jgi:hypothetical protein
MPIPDKSNEKKILQTILFERIQNLSKLVRYSHALINAFTDIRTILAD